MKRADAVLERIQHRGPTAVTLEVLGQLQRQFLLHVPFENLDIVMGQPFVATSDAVFEKIVGRRRGGFCYECNGLFADLIEELGFEVHFLSARMRDEDQWTPEFDHMVLGVRLEHDYIVDVGNGSSFRSPLRLDGTNEDRNEGKRYRVTRDSTSYRLEMTTAGGEEFQPKFRFSLTRHQRREFDRRCQFHQTHIDSPFRKKRLATLATEDGRITLLDDTFRIRDADQQEEVSVRNDRMFREILETRFGIHLPRDARLQHPHAGA